ncbi:MAG: LamG domain-containing protein, partial [Candidatus Gracilibacteria bacterium]|nr:LamG domain-containing protein [Candidatus Gracilibacteria bacterium]
TGLYPQTESGIKSVASCSIIATQGYFGDNATRIINMNQIPLDPLDKTRYTYLTNLNNTKYELLTLLEGNPLSYNLIIQEVYATDNTLRVPSVLGNSLGVILDTNNNPIQESGTNIDLLTTNSGTTYKTVFSNSSSGILTGSGNQVLTAMSVNNKELSNLDNSLVGYWDMETRTSDGKLKDLSGYHNDGIVNGTIISSGIIGNARIFNGISDNITITGPNLNFTTNGNFTISIWLNPDTFTSKNGWKQEIMSLKGGYLSSGYRFGINEGTGYPIFWDTQEGGNLVLYLLGGLQLKKWNNLVIKYNSQIAYMYLNNVIVSSATGSYIAGNNTTQIGGGYWDYFSGAIDEVRIYNRALSDQEIQNLYNVIK